MTVPPCPQCHSQYVYLDQLQCVCPECGHEWNPDVLAEQQAVSLVDANGSPLREGDSVVLIKDLKVKGSSQVLKIGTKGVIRRIIEGKDHQLDCKLRGHADMMITAKFVKKAQS